MDFNDEEIITYYLQTWTPEAIAEYLDKNQLLSQQCWLTGALHILEQQVKSLREQQKTCYAIAMADACGDLKHYKLSLPPSEE